MQTIDEELLDNKPEIELIDGIEVPKMSPKRTHSLLQSKLCALLQEWAGDNGSVGPEWRFHLDPDPEHGNSYVPDVAYVSAARLDPLSDDEAEEPPFAPDVAVEIRSPGDRERNIARKIRRYLEHGARIVIDVDPRRRALHVHDTSGAWTLSEGATFEHPELPGLQFSVTDYFASADRKRSSG